MVKFLQASILCSLFFISQGFLGRQIQLPLLKLSQQDKALNFNKKLYQLLSLGQNRLISSILWVKTLIDSDIEHYQKDDLNSWMYHRFDTITTLDPKFKEAYLYGGQYLSIVKDDEIGAKEIYERGVKVYPKDFLLNFNTGFHYLFELGDYAKAYQYFLPLVDHPQAPKLLAGLVSKLKLAQGDYDASFEILLKAYQNTPKDSPLKKYYEDRLYSLKAQKDLECLNSRAQRECSKTDFLSNPYLLKEGKYVASRVWNPVQLNFVKN